MLRVAAAMLALLPVHQATPASLSVYPSVFSPNATSLLVTGRLAASTEAGLRLETAAGRSLGWLLHPSERTSILYSWHGHLGKRPVPDGFYRVQLVSGTRTLAQAVFRLDSTAPTITAFSASNGGRPYAGDTAMLTTVSLDDPARAEAHIAFTLDETATVAFQVERTSRTRTVISEQTTRLGPGRHTLTWAPAPATVPRTYLLELTATDRAGNSRGYGAESPYVSHFLRAPVVRVLGIDANFTRTSYAPDHAALLRVRTDAPSFTVQLFRVGGEPHPASRPSEMSGLPVDDPFTILWASHENAPASITLLIGDWNTGVYYAELKAADGRVGYAPFVLVPPVFGAASHVAVVMSTDTWQAYNFYDANGDGWGDTWYAGRNELHARLVRPYDERGVPPKFTRYEAAFINWMARMGKSADFLSEQDLQGFKTGRQLRARYQLIVFPGHTEYVTDHEYDLVEQFRDAGGHLIFLSANNFFRRVVVRDGALVRTKPWRQLGRPEAALLGAEYRANDEGSHQGDFVIRNTARTPWLWQGLDLSVGSTFGQAVGGYGIEIDATTPDSPPGTVVLAEIPNLLGPGLTAQMTYYETKSGAEVFDAGTLDFVGSSLTFPVNHLLLNLWNHLAS